MKVSLVYFLRTGTITLSIRASRSVVNQFFLPPIWTPFFFSALNRAWKSKRTFLWVMCQSERGENILLFYQVQFNVVLICDFDSSIEISKDLIIKSSWLSIFISVDSSSSVTKKPPMHSISLCILQLVNICGNLFGFGGNTTCTPVILPKISSIVQPWIIDTKKISNKYISSFNQSPFCKTKITSSFHQALFHSMKKPMEQLHRASRSM